jgi:hypothetical protein
MRVHRETLLRTSTAVLLAVGLGACDQPRAKCNIARGIFSARYTLVAGTVTGGSSCETQLAALAGEELYVQGYSQRKSGTNYPDSDNLRVGIISSTQQGILSRAECSGVASTAGDTSYAIGGFSSSKPDDNDFCHVPTLTASQVTVTAQDSCQPDPCQPALAPEPAHDARYEWSNVRVYVTAAANGTQFGADLKYTMDGCSAQYKVVAIYPSVSCAGFPSTVLNPATGDDAGSNEADPRADAGLGGMDGATEPAPDAAAGSDASEHVEGDAGGFVPPADCDPPAPAAPAPIADDKLCSPDAPLSPDGPTGSNINPAFMVQCDSQLLRCVLSGDPPSLR